MDRVLWRVSLCSKTWSSYLHENGARPLLSTIGVNSEFTKTELEIPDYMRRVYAVMAQLAVAIGLGPICWGFESPWRYHIW